MGILRSTIKSFLGLCVLYSAPVFAAGVCAPATLTVYEAQGSCTIGTLTYSAFNFMVTNDNDPGGMHPKNTDDVFLTPSSSSSMVNLNISATNPLTVPFFVPPGDFVQYSFGYFVDPPPPIIHGSQITVNNPEPVTVQASFCENGNFPSCGDSVTITATDALPAETTFPTDLSSVGVKEIITLDATDTANSSNVGFRSLDNILFLTTAATPEPSSTLLIPGGLLCLFAFRSRAKLREVVGKLRF